MAVTALTARAGGRFAPVDPAVRLWARVSGPWNSSDVEPDHCWYFAGRARNRWGYARFHCPQIGPGVNVGAHVAAYVFTYGPVPAGQVVCHRCNHKTCCNPAHLFAATQSENVKQAWRETRRRRRAA